MYLHDIKPGHAYRFFYTNYRGEYEQRHVIFRELSWGSTEYYPELQFLFTGFDVDKDEVRSFSLPQMDVATFSRFTDYELKLHLNPPPEEAPASELQVDEAQLKEEEV